MAEITAHEVAHVARLARLELTAEELERFTSQLARVLEHARDLEALQLDGVDPTAHPFDLANVMRSDLPQACGVRDEALAMAPVAEAGMFRVPPILGERP